MYESKRQVPISRISFLHRVLGQVAWVLALLAISLSIGMVGYVFLEGLSWIDAFLNSAMLLGGMGPVNPPQTFSGKLFAGLFALYAGAGVYCCCGSIIHTCFAQTFASFSLG
jgi:hypothetical protein